MSIKINFYYNAFLAIESDSTRLVFDPWTTKGILDSGWYPKFEIPDNHFQDEKKTHFLVSHPHPDHFDLDFLLAQENSIYLPDFNMRSASRLSKEKTLVPISPWSFMSLGDFEVTCTTSLNRTGIDSTFLVRHHEMNFLIGSDDSPKDNELIMKAKNALGVIHFAALNYSRADDHPGMFRNLTIEGMQKARRAKLDVAFDLFSNALSILQPLNVLPYAGDYVLRSECSEIKQYLGLCSPSEAIEFAKKNSSHANFLFPDNGHCWKFEHGEVVQTYSITANLKPLEKVPQRAWYNEYELPKDVVRKLQQLINDAIPGLSKRLSNCPYRYFYIEPVDAGFSFRIDLSTGELVKDKPNPSSEELYIFAKINVNYLIHLLNGFSEWTAAQSGLHIEWYRKNDIYSDSFHSALFFFRTRSLVN